MAKILVVEDEQAIRDFTVVNLKRNGYETLEAGSGEEALTLYRTTNGITMILLDIMMPGIEGTEVCKQIRSEDEDVGIIMLSAKSQEMDKVAALSFGADDYITKPFSVSELVARCDALCRRIEKKKAIIIESPPFVLNITEQTIYKKDRRIELTAVEFMILRYLMENKGERLSREQILDKVWGRQNFVEVKAVDVNIRRLRMKLEDDPSEPKYLKTVWGFGYIWGK